MQSKVSMVVPCYNKVKYAAGMFDSVLAQEWDNLELILVNDGSTDGTREIISEYTPKFRKRGFEVLIIDQKNAGASRALLNGLKMVTGDYVCVADCDDKLHPEYVSAMASYLDSHPETGRIMCDHTGSQWRRLQSKGLTKHYSDETRLFEYPIYASQLLFRVAPTCYTNMVRTSYLSEHSLSNYSTLCRASYEPGYNALLFQNKEQPVYIHRVLYQYIYRDESVTSYQGSREQIEKHYVDYSAACEESIKKLDLSDEDKNRLVGCAKIGLCWHINSVSVRIDDPVGTVRRNIERVVSVANEYFGDLIEADIEKVRHTGFSIFHRVLSNRIIGYKKTDLEKLNYNRIIAYGHGKVGRFLLPLLGETPLKPKAVWDKGESGRYSFDDIPIRKPDMTSLREDDLVLLLISDPKVAETVYDLFNGDYRDNILPYADLLDYLGDFYF